MSGSVVSALGRRSYHFIVHGGANYLSRLSSFSPHAFRTQRLREQRTHDIRVSEWTRSGRELNCGVSERTLTKLSGLGKLCLGLSLWQSVDLCRMVPGAFVFRSVVLIMHAVLLVPSVVAVPFMRPANASERA